MDKDKVIHWLEHMIQGCRRGGQPDMAQAFEFKLQLVKEGFFDREVEK